MKSISIIELRNDLEKAKEREPLYANDMLKIIDDIGGIYNIKNDFFNIVFDVMGKTYDLAFFRGYFEGVSDTEKRANKKAANQTTTKGKRHF